MTPEKNLGLMKTLDDSWNSQDLTVFRKRHAKNYIIRIRWPNQPPTNGIEAHEQEAMAFFQTFPDPARNKKKPREGDVLSHRSEASG